MKLKLILSISSVLVLATSVWLLFGWQTIELPALGVIKEKRWFGKTLTVSCDKNRDGRFDLISKYTWNHPYEGLLNGPCVYPGVRHKEDRDLDGRWDTWSEDRCDRPEIERYLMRADTTGDGVADVEIATNDSYAAYKQIEKARGF